MEYSIRSTLRMSPRQPAMSRPSLPSRSRVTGEAGRGAFSLHPKASPLTTLYQQTVTLPKSDLEAGLQQLKKHFTTIHPLHEEEWRDLSGIWQLHKYKRKTTLTAAGETERYLYFVLEGIQRAFYIDAHHEATLVFTYPYSFSGIADSFLTQLPSRYFLETLTGSTLLRTTHSQLQQLMDKHRNIEKLIARSTSFALMGVLERHVELLAFSAEEKFRTLLKRSPHVLHLIPHKYLASYLGMDATTFSKLMATVRIE